MPRKSPYRISLSSDEEEELLKRSSKYTLPYFRVLRAKMILLAARGLSNDQIAAKLDTRREVVSGCGENASLSTVSPAWKNALDRAVPGLLPAGLAVSEPPACLSSACASGSPSFSRIVKRFINHAQRR
ncbi:MAG: hypothetical protein P8X90_31430 [Desulfobacterales bacterium]